MQNRRADHSANGGAWREPQIKLALQGKYTPASGVIDLTQAQIVGNALACDAKGKITATGCGEIDLTGEYQYDWEQLSPLLRPYLGPHVTVAGRQTAHLCRPRAVDRRSDQPRLVA